MAPAWLTQPKLPEAVKRKNPFSFIKPDGTTDLLPDEYDEAIALFKHGVGGHSYDDFIEEQNRKLKLRDQYFRALWGKDYRERFGAGDDRGEVGNKERGIEKKKPRDMRRAEQGAEGSYLDLIRSGLAPSLTAGILNWRLANNEEASNTSKTNLYPNNPNLGFDKNGNRVFDDDNGNVQDGQYFGGVYLPLSIDATNKQIKIGVAEITPEAREALLDDEYRSDLINSLVEQYNKQVHQETGKELPDMKISKPSLDVEILAHVKGYEWARETLENDPNPIEAVIASKMESTCSTIDIGGVIEPDRLLWDVATYKNVLKKPSGDHDND